LTDERVRRYTGKLPVLHQYYSNKVSLYDNVDKSQQVSVVTELVLHTLLVNENLGTASEA